jgi:hypothetical protein
VKLSDGYFLPVHEFHFHKYLIDFNICPLFTWGKYYRVFLSFYNSLNILWFRGNYFMVISQHWITLWLHFLRCTLHTLSTLYSTITETLYVKEWSVMKYFVSSNLSVGLFDTNLLDGDHDSLRPLQEWAWVYRSQIVFKHVGERKWYFIR